MLRLNCMLNLIGFYFFSSALCIIVTVKTRTDIYMYTNKTGILKKLLKTLTVQIGYNPKVNSQIHVF